MKKDPDPHLRINYSYENIFRVEEMLRGQTGPTEDIISELSW